MKEERLKVFAERLQMLRDERNLTITDFAEVDGEKLMTRQAMSFYLSGDRLPDASVLAKMCKALNVSADWLLGLSDTRKPEPDARAAVEYTGLKPEAVDRLHSGFGFRKSANAAILSDIITNKKLNALLASIFLAARSAALSNKHIASDEDSMRIIGDDAKLFMNYGYLTLDAAEAFKYYIQQAGKKFEDIVSDCVSSAIETGREKSKYDELDLDEGMYF